MDVRAFLQALLLYVVLPVWVLAGFSDYLCHRAMRIEVTAGWRESALHWLMLVELGIGVGAVLLLQLNAAVIALFAAACVLHEITLWSDLAYANAHRQIPAIEQWVHGVQQAIPWMVLLIIAALRPGEALAIAGLGTGEGDWTLRPRASPLDTGYLTAFAAGGMLLVALPFAEEGWRTLRTRHGGQARA